jgi:hypothetical protein
VRKSTMRWTSCRATCSLAVAVIGANIVLLAIVIEQYARSGSFRNLSNLQPGQQLAGLPPSRPIDGNRAGTRENLGGAPSRLAARNSALLRRQS